MTEKEYIEKNHLINTIINSTAFYDATVLRLIKREPTADVEEVRHASWVYGEYDNSHCSDCGHEVNSNNISPYCPYCGAKMDK